MQSKHLKLGAALFMVAIILLAGMGFMGVFTSDLNLTVKAEYTEPSGMVWEPFYAFNSEGYEPSIAVDANGYLYYTAHKNVDRAYQDRLNTWGGLLASWFFMSKDGGRTWEIPSDPAPQGSAWKYCLGDEGDIAVDANEMVYYVDTTIRDLNWHVWQDGEWQYSNCARKSTRELDDRPWVSAHGDGIVHYLGNNAVTLPGDDGRYIYYRSTDGAQTQFDMRDSVPGNGWLHMDAEKYGSHAYIVKEMDTSADQDIVLHVTDDYGETWNWDSPIYIGHRDGPGGPPGEGSRWPVVAAGQNGTVFTMWGDFDYADEDGTKLFLGRSNDYGQTWNSTEITPFTGMHDYFWLSAGPNGSIGVSFYSTTDLPTDDDSDWYIYGGMMFGADTAPLDEIVINATRADPNPVYTGIDYHALHDFHENVVAPDGTLNIAYQYFVGPGNGDSQLYYVKGHLGDADCDDEVCPT